MTELSKHIGANTDVPADMVLEEEKLIYVWSIQRLRNEFTGILTVRDFH
jgi:glutamate dehydrogenase/leucine dehydrogenase